MATDAHILIKSPLKEHGFEREEIELLQGKFIHYTVFNEIYKFHEVRVVEEGFECSKNAIRCLFRFSEFDGKYPNYEAVIPSEDKISAVNKIGMNAKFLEIVSKVTLSETKNVVFNFNGANSGVIIKPEDKASKEVILLMPFRISDTF